MESGLWSDLVEFGGRGGERVGIREIRQWWVFEFLGIFRDFSFFRAMEGDYWVKNEMGIFI